MSSRSSLEISSLQMWHVMPKSFYSELSGPLQGIDRDSESPVLVDLPSPRCTAQDWLPPSVDQHAEPSMGDPTGPPTEDPRLVRDLPDVIRELDKLVESTDSDYPHPGDLTSPAPTIPGCWIPRTEHPTLIVTPTLSSTSESAGTEDGVRAVVVPSPSPEVVLSDRANVRSRGPVVVPVTRSQSPFSAPPSPITSIAPPSPYQHLIRQPISSTSPMPILINPPRPTYPIEVQPPPSFGPRIPAVIHHYHSTASSESDGFSPIAWGTAPLPNVLGPRHDDELWFEDGNIALQTSNIEFRVYKGPLLALSPVLKAMCEDKATSLHPGTFGYLSLSDTSPEDLRHVLRFVYGGTSRIEPSFSEISAHIRFGHKYKAEKLLQRSIEYLKKFYVTDLDAWLQLPSLDPPFFEPVHAIGVVNLARLLGKDGVALLPMALMQCCTLGAEIVEGYTRENGTKETLSPADLGRCFEGKAKLLEANIRAAETLRADMTSDECNRPRRCKATMQSFVDELVGSEDSTGGVDGAGTLAHELRCLRWDLSFSLSSRRAYLQEAGAEVGEDEERELCPKCFARQLEEQRKIFATLPQLMGVSVEGWAAAKHSAAA
ncbi:hypothetical protein LXA43DRAFT_1108885 [Ganoderma leucocontextum]|nr:hypothetical protein LXA43DRAFT_1108885 [Ganoderma leucocontextum]